MPPEKLTTLSITKSTGEHKLTMLTAYDAPTARCLDAAGIDILLVGDSLGMVVLGLENTLQVTVEMMCHHTRAVARGRQRALLVADMPFMSYHTGVMPAVENAGELIRAGAEAVKLEGGQNRVEVIEALIDANIPVMGHLGLTPQSVLTMGGFKVQAKALESARRLIEDAKALERAGVFSIVLEGIPSEVAREVTRTVSVPTIGIGAGPDCDGQVLVIHDVLGLGQVLGTRKPKFVRRFASLDTEIQAAAERFAKEVKAGSFPSQAEAYTLPADVASAFNTK
jgi:3-methyl-2-oxobutanoate hydroxymethyltransferase